MTTDASSATGGVCVHLTNAADPSAGRVTAHCPPGLVSNKATGGQILRRVVAAINETLATITAAPGEAGRTGEPATTPPFWSIDFALLRTQKRWLSSLREAHPEAEGLLALLDSIQDHATDLGGMPEATVFGYELADHDHWKSVVDAAAEAFTFDSERAEHVALATDAAGRWTRVIGCYATLARALAGEPEDPETRDTVPVVVTRTPSLDEYTVRVGEAIVARIGGTAQQRAEGL
jgi:hypothetical protein